MTEENSKEEVKEAAEKAAHQTKSAVGQTKRAAKETLRVAQKGTGAVAEVVVDEAQEAAENVDEVVHDVARAIDGKIALEFALALAVTVGAGALAFIKGQQLLEGRSIV